MAQSTTVTLLPYRAYPSPNSGIAVSYFGDKQPAAAYYLASKDLQTISWSMSSGSGATPQFVGIIKIEASLVTQPTESDWFPVYTINTANQFYGYHNLPGNFVWLRGTVSNWTAGVINLVSASY